MSKLNIAFAALAGLSIPAAVALAGIAYAPERPAPVEYPESWNLVVQTADGESFIADHGLTLGDCFEESGRITAGAWIICERETR